MERTIKKIVWLASYPKSGNTWFRVFLSNLLSDQENPVHINELKTTSIASSRNLFDEITGIASSDLTKEEIEDLKPEVFKQIAENAKMPVFYKVHDAWTKTQSGKESFPSEITKGVLYFIRNPLDVAVSFAFHNQLKPDQMIHQLNNPDYALCSKQDRIYNQFMQPLNNWSGHVKSWIVTSGLPVKVLRYEDMLERPFETFKSAILFLGFEKEDALIEKAIEFSKIEKLKQMEKNEGFFEKPQGMKSFFRKGVSGDWRKFLKEKDVQEIIQTHRDCMLKFGYLD